MKKKGQMIILLTAIVIIVALRIVTNQPLERAMEKHVRQPVVAGSWYPGDRGQLNNSVHAAMQSAERRTLPGRVMAIIAPHAGYTYSESVIAASFKQVEADFDKVVVLGTSHHYPLIGAAIANYTHYATPLGEIQMSSQVLDWLKEPDVKLTDVADVQEHSIEMELPFVQIALPTAKLVPIVVGQLDPTSFEKSLSRLWDSKTLIVASVDMSHYHPYAEAEGLDNKTVYDILKLDDRAVLQDEIDSPWAISSLLILAKDKGWRPYLIKYLNSGDITGDQSSVVGYGSIAFVENTGISEEDQRFLLELARKTLKAELGDGLVQPPDETKLPKELLLEKGCFVTLNENNNLRGCIGHILPQEALFKCVMDNAINAAIHDPRFNPVNELELDKIQIEISILTVPEALVFSSPTELLNKLVPMRDGVVLESGNHGATYLPQVWEMIQGKEDFLSELCKKGGASADCWKDPNTKVFTYHAQVFGENKT